MEHIGLACQVCLVKFKCFFDLKKHVRSKEHHKKMEEVFQKDKFTGPASIPYIIFMDKLAKCDIKQPIIGLSLLTLCFSPRSSTYFYLCHVCEEKCSSDNIVCHLNSGDHGVNYFNYTDPNVLSFSWMPSMDMRVILRPHITQEPKHRGPEHLQLLDLPDELLKKCETSTYSEVMLSFSENEKLLKLFEAVKPKKMMIQTYHKLGNRKHPLLGLQHLIECICVGQTERRHFLCTLCNLTLAAHMIIKHVLSFDHIFCYFKAWHPTTLLSKESYIRYSSAFATMMLNFAKQAEKIHGSANTDIKQVNLEPDVFTLVNSSGYAEALKKLESTMKEKTESSLITSVTPGNKLTLSTVSVWPVASPYTLRCQNCNVVLMNVSQYFKHVFKWEHQQVLKNLFGKDEIADGYDQSGRRPNLGLFRYLKNSEKQDRPVIGISLVVTCLCAQVPDEPIYVCFACEESFSDSFLTQHLEGRKHLIHTLLYQNPWQLPFAWQNHLDVEAMTLVAWEEEKKRGLHHLTVEILDVPSWLFRNLNPLSYQTVIESLDLHRTFLKRQVPPCEPYSKLKENERFPLLGKQFLVKHNAYNRQHQSTEVRFLCLLCERRLSKDECYAHLFSWEHVATFLKLFHPGSLNASTENAETLLDLAKQAASIHSILPAQEIWLEKPIWEPCKYHRAISILGFAKKRAGKGKLKPPIIRNVKLVPRETLKEADKSPVREDSPENSRIMEASEKKNSQKTTDNSETTLENISVEVGVEITNKSNDESGENAEKGAAKEMIKEMMQEPTELTLRKPSEETPESSQKTGQDDRAVTGKEGNKSSKDVLTQLKNYVYKENKRERPSDMSEYSQVHKRQRPNSKEDASCEEPQKMSSSGQKEVTAADKGESCKSVTSNGNQQAAQLWLYLKKKSREPVIGLGALLECYGDQHGPIYLCECCSMKIQEKDIVSHVTGFDHQKMYLVGFQKIPPPQGNDWRKKMRDMAVLFEEDKGYGEAQVVDLDEELYNSISKQNFQAAIKTVKAHQAQLDCGCEISSTSTLSGVQPVGTSVTLITQHESYLGMDNHQVLPMEIDNDSEDSERKPSSVSAATTVMTENTPKTTEVPPEPNEDVKMTHIKVPESADNTKSCLTASGSSKDASILHMFKSGTNTLCLHPDSTGTNSKAEITPTTSDTPLNRTTTSKITGTCQTAVTSDSIVTTPAKSMTAVSKFTAKTSGSSPDTNNLTAAVSKLAATTSSCTATTTKLGETTNKCTAATSSTPATTAKSTIPTSVYTATTSKFTAASSKVTGTTSTSSATISNTTLSTKSATASKPMDPRTGAAPKAAATSQKAAPAPHVGSTVRREATCRAMPASKIENCSKNSETAFKTTVSSQTVVTSAKMTKMSIKGENAEASAKTVHMKSSVGSKADVAPHIHKSNPPAAPHGTMPLSVSSEHKNPPTEPSHTSMSKTKSTEGPPKLGVNHLIKVFCKGRTQVYCELCLVRLKRSTHVSGSSHHYNYVKMKYPGWSPRSSQFEEQFDKIVAHLAEVEKGEEHQDIQTLIVKSDMYEELATLPEEKAVEKLKALMRQMGMQISSSSTNNTAEALGRHLASASPSSSPDDVIKQENFKPDVETEAQVEVTPASTSPVTVEKPHVCADPLATDSGTFDPTADAHQETLENRQQQVKSDPELRDTQKELEGTQRKSPSVSVGPDPVSAPAAAASLTTEQQNPSSPNEEAEHAKKNSGCRQGPEQHSPLQVVLIGERTQDCSHLSKFLKVVNKGPIIGQSCVWECRGLSQDTFYLCESCSETVSFSDICQHMISSDHQYNYMQREYPNHLSSLWKADLFQEMRLQLLNEVAKMLAERERCENIDVQGVILGKDLYDYVQKAPFSKALEMVQNIKEQKMNICLPLGTPQQKDKQPEDWQSQEESFHREMQSSPASETDKSSDNSVRQRKRKHRLEEVAKVGDLDSVKQRRILSPPDVGSVPSKANSVDPSYPGASTCLSPQETCRKLSTQTHTLRSLNNQQQNRISQPDLQGKQAEVLSEFLSSTVCPKTSQTLSLSPSDEYPPTRKRPTVASVETLVRPCTNSPKLQDPLAAKRTDSSLQPISQPSPKSTSYSTSVNPAATLAPLSSTGQDTWLGPDGLTMSMVDLTKFEGLKALMRERKSKMSPCKSDLDNAEITTSCATNFSKGVTNRQDSKCVLAGSQVAKNQKRWDSKIQVVKAQVKKGPPSTNSLEGMISTAAPVVLGYENQRVNPNGSCAISAINSSFEGYLTEGNQAAGTMLPTAGTANSSDQKHQGSDTAHSMFGNVSQITPILGYGRVATNHNSGQMPQPRGNTYSTEVCQFPIKTITTVMPDPTNQQFMGGYNKQDHTEVHRGAQPASGGYGHFSYMAYVTNGHSGFPSSEAAAGYTTLDTPSVYSGSLHQSKNYPEQEGNGFSLPSFGHSLATPVPPGWMSLEMQKQLMVMQQQQLVTQQQQQQQQLMSTQQQQQQQLMTTQQQLMTTQQQLMTQPQQLMTQPQQLMTVHQQQQQLMTTQQQLMMQPQQQLMTHQPQQQQQLMTHQPQQQQLMTLYMAWHPSTCLSSSAPFTTPDLLDPLANCCSLSLDRS
ncbi:uncharacterized protein LOC121913511 [Thunnus maccoyii]|uniref:uncharacterized protein LOC121913511 n=1 Tax=Thunnus maccoyii TaxID=8240 RepID=UPI001C4A8F09|nr:uncharacterized protein LOC121913511 [Thunnus maccoyii]